MKHQKLLKNCLMAGLISALSRAVRVVCFVSFSALEKPFSTQLSSRKTTLSLSKQLCYANVVSNPNYGQLD